MSYYNEDQSSFSYDYESIHNQSFQTQTQFLKDKLIETHEKLMRELTKTKELQEKLLKIDKQNQSLYRQNEQIQSKFSSLQKKLEFNRSESQKNRILQMKISELEKKNDLLKADLESMRSKMLEVIVEKNGLQEDLHLKDQLLEKMNEKANAMGSQIRQRNKDIKYLQCEVDAYKRKYEGINESFERAQNQLHELRRENKNNYENRVQSENYLRQQREKSSKLMNQIITIQAEHKQALHKLKETENQCQTYKDEIYWFQNKEKSQSKNAHEKLQKLTSQLNNMSTMYKQKQKELEMAKRRPLQNLHKRKKNLQNTREFVQRLESEEHSKRGKKILTENQFERSVSPKNKKYKQEKDSYISMISEVGEMETILNNCNLEKRKILVEIDKIQATKVKTKDMISRRRRLEDDLNYQEQKIKKVKEELRKMKVM